MSTESQLDFVTIDGLVRYAETLAALPPAEGASVPSVPAPRPNRVMHAAQARDAFLAFVERALQGFPSAQAYRQARQSLLETACGGDPIVFYAAWNSLVAYGRLGALT